MIDESSYEKLLDACYDLNQRTDKKVMPALKPVFPVHGERKECRSGMQVFEGNIDRMEALTEAIESIDSEYIFLYMFEFMFLDGQVMLRVRYAT